jgi:hypothetical protein
MGERKKGGGDGRIGFCKLTGSEGAFVESHLIPKALTKPGQRGRPFIQLEPGMPPIRRWSSWYDPALVTQVGEDILTELDTWGIAELRRRKLVWSSWGASQELGLLHHKIGDSGWGIRKLEDLDSTRMRRFLQSLLWRAAASDLREISVVALPADDLERLRLAVSSGSLEDIAFYPAQITQLSTVGPIHNHAPQLQMKAISRIEDDDTGEVNVERNIPFYRFYFDGLIIHFHAHASDDGFTAATGNFIVGAEVDLLVTTQTYSESFHESLIHGILDGSRSGLIAVDLP